MEFSRANGKAPLTGRETGAATLGCGTVEVWFLSADCLDLPACQEFAQTGQIDARLALVVVLVALGTGTGVLLRRAAAGTRFAVVSHDHSFRVFGNVLLTEAPLKY